MGMRKQDGKDVPVLELLKKYKWLGQRVSELAGDYIEQLHATQITGIEIGQFFQTIDGSVVCVVARHTQCQCAMCTGRAVTTSFGSFTMLLGGLLGKPPGAEDAEDTEDGTNAAEDASDHADADADKPKRWVVSVIRGGHGVKSLTGEKPGERYLVDDAGRTVLDAVAGDGQDMLARQNLSMAGLALKTRLTVTMKPEKAEA